jgi:uncharacterized membrane-anchored protein YitT (DUF2179 family)
MQEFHRYEKYVGNKLKLINALIRYIAYVFIGYEEHSSLLLNARQFKHSLQIVFEVIVVVAFFHVQLERVKVRDISGQLHDSALASAVNADQKHVTALLTQHATRT